MSGISSKRLRKSLTFEKLKSPNLISGGVGNIRFEFIINDPLCKWYKLLITRNKSDVFFTGKNRLRGTLIPMQFSKHLIPAPIAVSSCMEFIPLSNVFLFTIISKFSKFELTTRSIAKIIIIFSVKK